MSQPSPARRLIDQYWRLRYKDHNEAKTMAIAAMACADAPTKHQDQLWARFLILVCDSARDPSDAHLAQFEAMRAEFEAMDDEAGIRLVDVQRAIVLWYMGRSQEGWALLRGSVEPQLHRMEPYHRYTAYIGLLCLASSQKDEATSMRYSYDSLALARQLNDPSRLTLSLVNLADSHLNYGNFSEALSALREVMSLAERHKLYNRLRNAPRRWRLPASLWANSKKPMAS